MSESRTVLLVDDEDGVLLAYLACFQARLPDGAAADAEDREVPGTEEFEGYRFLVAHSGEEAVDIVAAEAAAGRRVACGFFDMKMAGGIDGVETIRRVRALDPQLLCTIVTAHVGDSIGELHGLFADGHVDEWDYLAKPFSRWEIVQKCRQMVGSWNRRRREEMQLAEIKRLNRELEIWGETLEKRVEERTDALATSQKALRLKNSELEMVLEQLSATQARLVQHETMASIGQLAAGVAAEVAQPIELIAEDLDALGAHGSRFAALMGLLEAAAASGATPSDVLLRARTELGIDHAVDAVPDLIAEARVAVGRISRITSGLRAFGRPLLSDASPVDVNAAVSAAAEMARGRLPRGARLEVRLSALPAVSGHAPAIEQALVNLLANAAEAVSGLQERGLVSVSSKTEGDDVVVEVEDNGCGMNDDLASRAFEPFFTTRPAAESAGLGLSVALGIVRQHGGDIDVATAPDHGAIFRVRLPASLVPAAVGDATP